MRKRTDQEKTKQQQRNNQLRNAGRSNKGIQTDPCAVAHAALAAVYRPLMALVF